MESPPTMKLFTDEGEEKKIWEIRESGLGATANMPGMPLSWPGWEDAAVDPARIGDYLREFRKLLDEHKLVASLYGHFGDGCIHCRISFDLFTHDGIRNYMAFIHKASDLVVRYGGSLSAEHGDGQSKAVFLRKMYGDELVEAFRQFKTLWDPEWKMNPGKVVDPYLPDQNLRLGTGYNPWQPPHILGFQMMRGVFPGPPCAVSGSASAAVPTLPSCARALWPPGRKSTPPAGGPISSSRCSAATSSRMAGGARKCWNLSNSAFPARGARATVRSMWTWPPTRRNSSPTTTGEGSGHCPLTPWADRHLGQDRARMPGMANFLFHAPLLRTITKALAELPGKGPAKVCRRDLHRLVQTHRETARQRPACGSLSRSVQ